MMDFIRGARKGMERFGHDIATLINTIILAVVYIIGVGITSLVAKIAKKRFLEMELNKKAKTYWNDLNIKKRKTDDYYRQF
jgi:hypothetical protein